MKKGEVVKKFKNKLTDTVKHAKLKETNTKKFCKTTKQKEETAIGRKAGNM